MTSSSMLLKIHASIIMLILQNNPNRESKHQNAWSEEKIYVNGTIDDSFVHQAQLWEYFDTSKGVKKRCKCIGVSNSNNQAKLIAIQNSHSTKNCNYEPFCKQNG